MKKVTISDERSVARGFGFNDFQLGKKDELTTLFPKLKTEPHFTFGFDFALVRAPLSPRSIKH